ncbi:MAG: trigger factor [Oscillospiraceae bacterium]|nr:trigger factor [Oscillospiraceae bacterium]
MAVITNNKIEENKYELLISINAEAFEKAVSSVYLRVRNQINIKGFRKGKAPRHMVEKLYGEDAFYEDAVRDLAPGEIMNAVEGEGFELVDTPKMEVISMSKEDGVEIKVTATVKPEVTISDYKGIEVEKVVKAVTEEALDERLQALRERNSRLVTVENRLAQDGDVVIIDFEGFIDGKPFDGGKDENFDLVLGSGQFIPGFEEQIIGKSAGDEFKVNVDFPEDYHSVELAGKSAEFNVVLHELQEKEMPELDDEFAKDTSEFETLDELREDLRQRMEKLNSEEADREAEDALFRKLAENVEAEIPVVMYEQKISEMVRDLEFRISRQGLTMESYLRFSNTNMTELRDGFREIAQLQVRVRLGLEKIAKLENLEITEEEVEAEINKIAETYDYTAEKVREIVKLKAVEEDLLVEKASELVKESAKFI